jgi:transposase-like protein
MGKATSKFSPEVRERAVRLILDNEGQQACHSVAAIW